MEQKELKQCKCGGRPAIDRGPTNPRDLDYMLTIRCQQCGEKVQRMTGGWVEKEDITLAKLTAEWNAKQGYELKPCPFCGGTAKIVVIEPGVRSMIHCTNHTCHFERISWNNGDTDDHAALRLATAWNNRTAESEITRLKDLNKKLLETAGILDAALREYQQKYGE